jgi:hypothetical protein
MNDITVMFCDLERSKQPSHCAHSSDTEVVAHSCASSPELESQMCGALLMEEIAVGVRTAQVVGRWRVTILLYRRED